MYTLLHMCFAVMSCRVPIGVPNVKEMDPQEGCFLAQIIVINRCKEQEKCEENQTIFRNVYLANY